MPWHIVDDLERRLVHWTRRISRSCNQMPDWIISITWNIYDVDKDPKCTSCRSLRRGGREYFERSMKLIHLERDDNLIDARRSLSQVDADSLTSETMKITLIVKAKLRYMIDIRGWAWHLVVMILRWNFPFDDAGSKKRLSRIDVNV